MKFLTAFLVTCLSFFSFPSHAQQHSQQLDVLIQGAQVFDGSGGEPQYVDVGVLGDKIVFVGPAKNMQAKKVIDAKGLILTPGFIDPHTHHEVRLNSEKVDERSLLRCLMQGVTTIFVGNDGSGLMPIGDALKNWETEGVGVNVGMFVPHGTVRARVIGYRNIGANSKQIEKMQDLVREGMEQGAFGLSTGLFYTPGFYSSTEEVVELAKVAARYGGIYDTHQRDEGSQTVGVINSVKEVLEIGEKAKIPVHISHIKVSGRPVWGLSKDIVDLVEKAQREGIEVSANQYPYIASRTSLQAALIPSWALDGGASALKKRFNDPILLDSILAGIRDNISARTGSAKLLLLSIPAVKELDGKSVQDIADTWKLSPEMTVVEILKKNSPSVHSFSMSEEDLLHFMKQPWVIAGSDGGASHPRAFGTFARYIHKYALEDQVLTLSEAVHKSTALTAKLLNIEKRGAIQEGYFADLFLFDPAEYQDRATFEDGEILAVGARYVLVNGELAIEEGEYTGKLSGKSLRKNKQ